MLTVSLDASRLHLPFQVAAYVVRHPIAIHTEDIVVGVHTISRVVLHVQFCVKEPMLVSAKHVYRLVKPEQCLCRDTAVWVALQTSCATLVQPRSVALYAILWSIKPYRRLRSELWPAVHLAELASVPLVPGMTHVAAL